MVIHENNDYNSVGSVLVEVEVISSTIYYALEGEEDLAVAFDPQPVDGCCVLCRILA